MHYLYPLSILFALSTIGVPAQANLMITPIFDSSITSQADASGIENAINMAIGVFETTYANPINVKIEFQAIGSGLGDSQEGFDYIQNYNAFYNALVTVDANPSAVAGLTARGGNSFLNPVNHTSTLDVKSANLRAVGLSGDPLCNVTGTSGSLTCSTTAGGPNAVDGLVGINTSITDPPQADNGSNYALQAVLEHEIDEVLGLGSAIPNCDSSCTTASATTPAPEDLFRYTAGGARSSLSVACANTSTAFFSYSGAVDLAQFNNACNGADFGDWQSNPLPGDTSAQVQDAFGSPGSGPSYGPNEIAALSAIGYQVATPEPATATLLFAALCVFAVMSRRLMRESL
jgi:hypothetical protein